MPFQTKMSAIEGSATLKTQFEVLQQQQQQKLARRKQKKDERDKAQSGKGGRSDSGKQETEVSTAFGIDDDLDLKVSVKTLQFLVFYMIDL